MESLSFLRRRLEGFTSSPLACATCHRIEAFPGTEHVIIRARYTFASAAPSWVPWSCCKTFAGPAAASAAPTPHHAGRPAWEQEGARTQATCWAECGQHGIAFSDAIGLRTRRLHHAELITACRRRPEVRPSEQAVHDGSTSNTHHIRLMAAAT